MDEYDRLFKLIVIGDAGVGKTHFIHKFVDNIFGDFPISNICVDFHTKIFEFDDNKVKLQIWDTAGQERFRTLTSSYYRGADGILLFYDISNLESFKNIERWLHDIKQNTTDNIKVILIAHKYDLDKQRIVSTIDGKNLAKKNELLFSEASSLTDFGINEVFTELCRQINIVHVLDETPSSIYQK